MLRKLSLCTIGATLAIVGMASTASAHKALSWFSGANVGIGVTHVIYQGFLFNDTHSQSRDFVKLEPNVPNSIADDYEFQLNNRCNGVWDGWSPSPISAELGWNVHDYCPTSSMTTSGGATWMGEK